MPPTLDHLFDRGLITFDADGSIVISVELLALPSVLLDLLNRYFCFHLAAANASALPVVTRLVQGLNSPAVALLVSMIVTLGHRYRLVAGTALRPTHDISHVTAAIGL